MKVILTETQVRNLVNSLIENDIIPTAATYGPNGIKQQKNQTNGKR
jgi:hypothetical protein